MEPEKTQDLRFGPLVISILGITALSNSAFSIIAPFLPIEVENKHIDSSWMGYIFSIYSVAVVIGSPLVEKMVPILGRRNIVQLGMLLMGTSFIIFGQLDQCESKETFLALALLNRFLQGFASSQIQTTMYSISTNFFPDHRAAMVGYIEAATGIGMIFGPPIGAGLYSIGGYHLIYNGFGATFILLSFGVKVVFGADVDEVLASSRSAQLERADQVGDDFVRPAT